MRRALAPVLSGLLLLSGLPLLATPAQADLLPALTQNKPATPPGPLTLPTVKPVPFVAPVVGQQQLPLRSGSALPSLPAELPAELFTPTTRTTFQSDGSRTTQVYAAPTFKRVGAGWGRVDLAVTPQLDAAYPLAAPGAYLPVKFGVTPGSLAQVALPKGPVTLSGDQLAIAAPLQAGLGAVKHLSVFKDTDLKLQLSGDGLGTALTLSSPASPTSYRFHLADPKGQLGTPTRTADGGWVFSGDVGDGLHLVVPPAYAYKPDLAHPEYLPSPAPDVASVQITKAGDGFDLLESVDPAWVKTQGFPLVLDPTLTFVSPTAATLDCTLINGAVAANSYCAATRMELGYGSGAGTSGSLRRGLLFFGSTSLGAIPAGSRVSSAQLEMTLLDNFHGVNLPISAYEQPTSWNESATWNSSGTGAAWNGAATVGPLLSTTTVGTTLGIYRWDVGSYAQRNVNGQGAVGGLQLRMQTETGTTSRVLSFGNKKVGTPGQYPRLIVNYDPPTPVVDKKVALVSTNSASPGTALPGTTSTGPYAASQTAGRGQTVAYRVRVSIPTATTAQTVTVTDPLATGLGDPTALLIDGQTCAQLSLTCTVTPLSAVGTRGIRIANLPVAVGQTREITYASPAQGVSDRACSLVGNAAPPSTAALPRPAAASAPPR